VKTILKENPMTTELTRSELEHLGNSLNIGDHVEKLFDHIAALEERIGDLERENDSSRARIAELEEELDNANATADAGEL
jgi:peptidoglycan hydrolase CwlO-like protein